MKTDYGLLMEFIEAKKLYNPEWHYINGFYYTTEEQLRIPYNRIIEMYSPCEEYCDGERPYYKYPNQIISDCARIHDIHAKAYLEVEALFFSETIKREDLIFFPKLIGHNVMRYNGMKDFFKAYEAHLRVCKEAYDNLEKLKNGIRYVNSRKDVVHTTDFEVLTKTVDIWDCEISKFQTKDIPGSYNNHFGIDEDGPSFLPYRHEYDPAFRGKSIYKEVKNRQLKLEFKEI